MDTSIKTINAVTKELKDSRYMQEYENGANCVRVYNSAPGVASLQIRTFGGIGEFGKGKSRAMYSLAKLKLEQVDALIEALQTWKAEQ